MILTYPLFFLFPTSLVCRVFLIKHPTPWVWFLQLKDNAGLLFFLEFLNPLPAAAPRPLLSERDEGARTAGSTPGQCFTARMCQHEDQGVPQIKHHLAAFLSASSLSFSIFCLKLFDVKISNLPSFAHTSFSNCGEYGRKRWKGKQVVHPT